MTQPERPRIEPIERVRGQVLGAAFELLYRNRTLYWLASTVPFAGQWRVWQRRVVPRLVGHDVLEVGCGIGTLLAELVGLGYCCRAVDASPEMVAATRARLRRRGLAGRDVEVLNARVQRLPFGDAAFDTVVSTFPTPYIYDPTAIAEIARVLRPGGRLVVVEGARLLAAHPLLLPLVALQALVYGRPLPHGLEGSVSPGRSREPASVETETLAGQHSLIPLEAAGLLRREERDRAANWEAFVVTGKKPRPDSGTVTGVRITGAWRGPAEQPDGPGDM